jgi:hypothetical protein
METSYFHISFRPSFKLISTVRRFSEAFYEQTLDNREMSERVGLATHELLENAVAYATDGETSVRVEVNPEYIAVMTWNRASPARLAELKKMIDALNAAEDPDHHYQAMMQKTAHRTDGSGLGLARIRAEAGMTITYELTADRVCIQARAPHVVPTPAKELDPP